MSDIDFGKLFDKLCEQSGKSNTEIAKGLDVDKATIGRWRSGERSPKLSSLSMIADYFGVDIQIFSRGRNEKKSQEIFSTVEEAMQYILRMPVVSAYGGYDLEKMSDEEIIQFANKLTGVFKMLAEEYKK